METWKNAHNRWREILPALGIPAIFLNGKHQGCPLCGGKDRARFDDRKGNGDYFCNRCGSGNGFDLLKKFHGWDFKQVADEVDKIIGSLPTTKKHKTHHKITAEDVDRLWGLAVGITEDDPVANYFIGRGISPAHWPKALRYAARWKHTQTQKNLPCMLAMFSDAEGGTGTIHRTFMADVVPNRMFLPRPIPIGGAIRLFGAAEVMGVAEGIETALAATLIFKMPVWATTGERLLREWIPPANVKAIMVFGDNDANYIGQAAAYHLANRLVLRGYDVEVKIPDVSGWDWNDVLKEKRTTTNNQFTGEPLRHTDIQAGG